MQNLPDGLDPGRMPSHIAVIMDGNGRWAAARHLPRIAGHKAGAESVRAALRACGDLGIRVLTLYAFSTENWQRPKTEVEQLMRLLSASLRKETAELKKNNIKVMLSGAVEGLPAGVQHDLAQTMNELALCTGPVLNVALNYGGRQEIVNAINRIIRDRVAQVDENLVSGYLYTAGLPDPEIIIRTSGEMRLSNFLLWQAAYSELIFMPVLWPDFRKEHLIAAIKEYQSRNRRFGGI